VTEVPDLGSGTDDRSFVHVGRLVDEYASRLTGHALAPVATPGVAGAFGSDACHSWSDCTRGRRERSERIASDAALAADIVVVYDTRFTIAA
jgi:hypothetical protein